MPFDDFGLQRADSKTDLTRRFLYQPLRRVRTCFANPTKIQQLLFPYFFLSLIYALGVHFYGPFLRSLVVCDVKSEVGVAFSGSARCGDTNLVLTVAQAQEGRLVGMKLLVHGVAGPFLAVLADTSGRRPVLLLGMVGFTTAFFLFALVSGISQLHGSELIVSLCFFLEGATSAFDVVFLSMLADLTPSRSAARAAAFSSYFSVGALGSATAARLAVVVLRLQLRSYTVVWLLVGAAMAAVTVLFFCVVSETLGPEAKARAAARDRGLLSRRGYARTAVANILAPAKLIASSRFLQLWLGALLLNSLSSGILGVEASFTLAVYAWRPGDLQALTWPSQFIALCSLTLLGPLASRYKLRSVLLCSMLASCSVHLSGVLAPFTPVAIVGPSLFHSALAFGKPLMTAFLSGQFRADEQAKVHAVTHLCTNLGASVSIALFSGPLLFRPEARGWEASRPFLLSALLHFAGNGVRLLLICTTPEDSGSIIRAAAATKLESALEL
ncbi:unnamed protein product [Polarella glacialis]|uniref:Major facilitator superfamily (MFS) profile domain-containing protein n=1 Tax=Polarella glacialis TaxID=89957 RepID=A0A813KFW7_POLGL|nr:unnamed protein product [Polarella glacialis]